MTVGSLVAGARLSAQGPAATSAITGTVVGDDGQPVNGASVHAARTDRQLTRDVIADERGRFRLASLTAGVYTVTVRRVGYRSAELPNLHLAVAQTLAVNVTLTQAARQLSTISVEVSPTAVDVSVPDLSVRLDRQTTALVPSARDAASLIALVPGARKSQLWGGAPSVSNDYQLDGVSINHPGVGGDFLTLSVDWIDMLDVRGLGAGAEHGNFQGGIINAVTKTGSNERRATLRTNYESPTLAATNLNLNEEGVEQAGRRELSGELLGPIARDRLFYLVAGQFVGRDLRSPDLTTAASHDFQSTRESHTDARGMAKLTWLPAFGQRVDVLGGTSPSRAEHAGLNGVDDPTATRRVRQRTSFYALTWTSAGNARNIFDVRLAGFRSSESSVGYAGENVPGVQVLRLGRMPSYQNAIFDERRNPSTISRSAQWRTVKRALGADHRLVLGSDFTRGRWREQRTRNGGLTWRPYSAGLVGFDPLEARTWSTLGSDWGGERRFDGDVASDAVFIQDYASIGSRLTLTPGVRYGRWSGFARPREPDSAAATRDRFEAVSAHGFDPRIGVVWDVTGRSTLAVKAHWGRYHQGMFSLFYDRANGVNAYTNSRFYYGGPRITDSRTTYSIAERDASTSGFSTVFDEQILNESGRVDGYRQPYVDQTVLGLEKSVGSSLKAEIVYTHRRNGDIVGLVDRNVATNYSPIYDTHPDHRLVNGRVLDANGNRLVLPVMYVGNDDLLYLLGKLRESRNPGGKVAGYDTSYLAKLSWSPDVVLTAVPEARRVYDQLTVTLRAYRPRWRAEGSLTTARLRGNVAGVTGYGTTGTQFSAGPFVRPNEGINSEGRLPDALEFEGKLWLTARLPFSTAVGMLYTHTYGERFTPSFELLGRYVYSDNAGNPLPTELFRRILGQSIFVEPRGSRHYASRDMADLHAEWSVGRFVLTSDLFNVFGSNALLNVNTNIGDQSPTDPASVFGAARLRVPPRALRLGLRVE